MRRLGWLVLAFVVAPVALATEQLNWALMPNPGVVNLRDGQPYDGLIVEYLRLLDAQLSDVQVQYPASNHQRAINDISHGRNLCTAPLLRTPERDQIGYFVPLLISPPLQVVLPVSDLPRLPLIKGQLWLDQLLGSELLGGVVVQQVYPAKIEQARQALHGQLVGVNLTSNGDRLLLMLTHKRFDYVFDYPTTVAGFARAYPAESALVSVPVADFQDMPVFGSYCTHNDWGRAMSARIDAATRRLLARAQPVEAIYQRWLPVESWQHYGAQIKQFFRERAQQTPLVFAPAGP
jgi:uncharacterized protein (TIGR02285 family)